MRMKRIAAAFALAVCLGTSVPSSAAVMVRPLDPSQATSPIERVIQLIKRIVVRTFDDISIPRP